MSPSHLNVVHIVHRKLEDALIAWRAALGADHVLEGDDLRQYDNCPSQTRHFVSAALLPRTVDDVQKVVQIAAAHRVPLYPISRGHNWGFGGANPVVDHCAVVDLHLMNRIIDFDPDLGIITVEPGVTQQQIADFLKDGSYPFMISTILAGPNCSYLANALERGTGMMPPMDRFLSLHALKAVLPDGSLYQSLLSDAGCEASDRSYKWGVGPYVDGLFSQGSFGIVTQASFALARKPQQITRFYFSPRSNVSLEVAIDSLREAKQVLRGAINTLEFGNRTEAVYGARKPGDDPCSLYDHAHWTAYGSLHGSRRVSKAVIAEMKRILSPAFKDFVFVTEDTLKRMQKLPWLHQPTKNWRYVAQRIGQMLFWSHAYEGVPHERHLSYVHSQNHLRKNDRTPEKNIKDSGLLWFWPILPLRGKDLARFLSMLEEKSAEFGMLPNLNVTVGSETHLVANVHIFFDPSEDREKAHQFHQILFEESKKLGYLPHRPHIDALAWYAKPDESAYCRTLSLLKDALDPYRIMSPGRFGG